ncbi:hypothetical protein DTW94_11985 [Streptomyces cavourensis]|uniref:Uncharacterized protein n=1 Tax=Streptomyces cavourensis TaxID=67258 RepID=A0AAD0Q4B4_9ACTN|nr:hypothetical protein DTW94_11985 [Streptomyces cavourensis]
MRSGARGRAPKPQPVRRLRTKKGGPGAQPRFREGAGRGQAPRSGPHRTPPGTPTPHLTAR